ncbi:NADH dehydrogenase [ubiquinone] 1 alpha subcomplex subunit 8 isoform X2 [Diprion similis]|uniref:NADH dehydrogenase [ubiquinone] 1 alpha subcomplex subunit 8 isoform X2 n=1 Tax=Diprion similis TaxID=362088 RepID=UPI001EF97F7A|nr:NADH dehydrogenase [ubiquinone] 1 alpha subcomplex subunit 8 isoform X2 [Diprion similis]
MVITSSTYLPTEEELTVEEVNVGTASLRAASFHLGKHCEHHNNEFILCREEEDDPRRCLNEGKAVTACALDFFRKIKKTCYDEFTQYATCLDKSSGDMSFNRCRLTQAVYDKCVLDNLNIERPSFGYFCEVKVHDSPRPKPPAEPKAVYPDAAPKLPDDAPRPPARYGARSIFGN